jgi:hypothetical protein
MNIFVLDHDPVKAAQMQCDKHVVKMILESAQILSTVSAELGGIAPYRPTHVNHPCTIWARQSIGNWLWLVRHAKALSDEYTFRYGKIHKSKAVIVEIALRGARPKQGVMTPFVLCMPDEFKTNNAIESYRFFYMMKKSKFAVWKKARAAPIWWEARQQKE